MFFLPNRIGTEARQAKTLLSLIRLRRVSLDRRIVVSFCDCLQIDPARSVLTRAPIWALSIFTLKQNGLTHAPIWLCGAY